jgi:hypothetical protein
MWVAGGNKKRNEALKKSPMIAVGVDVFERVNPTGWDFRTGALFVAAANSNP